MNVADIHFKNLEPTPIWDLDIEKVVGHNIELKGREHVNKMLEEGWVLLHGTVAELAL